MYHRCWSFASGLIVITIAWVSKTIPRSTLIIISLNLLRQTNLPSSNDLCLNPCPSSLSFSQLIPHNLGNLDQHLVWWYPVADIEWSLTYWGRVMHVCIIGSYNGILWIGPLGTNLSEILIKIDTFSFKKVCLKVSSGKWQLFCLGLNVLKDILSTDSEK